MLIAIYYMEDNPQKSERKVQDLEIDAFDMLDGKMNDVAIERLHRQICSKIG